MNETPYKLVCFALPPAAFMNWAALREKVPNVLSRCHTKRGMNGTFLRNAAFMIYPQLKLSPFTFH